MFATMVLLALLWPQTATQAQTAPPQPSPNLPALSALDDRFVRDLHDKKIDDVLTLYTADAVFVNPDGQQITGPGLRKLYEQVTTAFDSDLHLTSSSVEQSGDAATENGSYTEALGHRDTGKIENVHGTYRFEFRRQGDGSWLFTRMEWH